MNSGNRVHLGQRLSDQFILGSLDLFFLSFVFSGCSNSTLFQLSNVFSIGEMSFPSSSSLFLLLDRKIADIDLGLKMIFHRLREITKLGSQTVAGRNEESGNESRSVANNGSQFRIRITFGLEGSIIITQCANLRDFKKGNR